MTNHCLGRILLLLISVFGAESAFASPPGFLWYNLPKQSTPLKKPGVPFSTLSYTDKDAVLKFYTMEALHKVRFTHRLEDERVFLALQDFWLREATIHGQLNQKALLYYPQYDFSVTHPTSAIGTRLNEELEYQKTIATVKKVARTQGLLFFYRGANPYDQKEIPIVQDFSKRYGFSLIPVSVDGHHADELPSSRVDHGQADALGVHYFPALILVNPKSGETTPLSYGLTTQDVIKQRLVAMTKALKGAPDES